MAVSIFAHEELINLQELIIEAGLCSSDGINGLIDGIDVHVKASLPTADKPSERLFKILSSLNRIEQISTEVPLRVLLINASLFVKQQQYEPRFLAYADKLNRRVVLRELNTLVEQSGVEDEELREIFRFCLRNPRRNPRTQTLNVSEITRYLTGERHPTGGKGFPLLLFAALVAHHSFDVVIQMGVEEWIVRTANLFKLQLDQNLLHELIERFDKQLTTNVFEKICLMVMVTKVTADSRNIDISMHWKYQDGYSERCADAPGTIHDISELSEVVYEVLGEKIRCTIEIFLPSELMNFNIEFPDKWSKSLLRHHRIVRRFAERQKKQTRKFEMATQANSYWEFKWQQVQKGTDVVKNHHLWIDQAKLADAESLDFDLTRPTREICCTSPSFAPKEQLTKLLERNLSTGVPICFWSNNEQADLKAEFHACLTEYYDDFRIKIHELQELGLDPRNASHIGKLLYLIWDDPERPFPGTQKDVSLQIRNVVKNL